MECSAAYPGWSDGGTKKVKYKKILVYLCFYLIKCELQYVLRKAKKLV